MIGLRKLRVALKVAKFDQCTESAGDGRQGGEGQKSQGGVKHRITGRDVFNKAQPPWLTIYRFFQKYLSMNRLKSRVADFVAAT